MSALSRLKDTFSAMSEILCPPPKYVPAWGRSFFETNQHIMRPNPFLPAFESREEALAHIDDHIPCSESERDRPDRLLTVSLLTMPFGTVDLDNPAERLSMLDSHMALRKAAAKIIGGVLRGNAPEQSAQRETITNIVSGGNHSKIRRTLDPVFPSRKEVAELAAERPRSTRQRAFESAMLDIPFGIEDRRLSLEEQLALLPVKDLADSLEVADPRAMTPEGFLELYENVKDDRITPPVSVNGVTYLPARDVFDVAQDSEPVARPVPEQKRIVPALALAA